MIASGHRVLGVTPGQVPSEKSPYIVSLIPLLTYTFLWLVRARF